MPAVFQTRLLLVDDELELDIESKKETCAKEPMSSGQVMSL